MNRKPLILFAEDEPALGRIVRDVLQSQGYDVMHAANGTRAAALYREKKPDLLLFDVMLPGIDGFALAREIRRGDRQTPLLFITAKTMPADVLEGFDAGANDYLRKPFDLSELCARIKALLSRFPAREATQPELCAIGEYRYHPLLRTLTYRDVTRKLAAREGEVLMALYRSRNRQLPRKELLLMIWKDDDFFSSRSLDVYVSRIRKYLRNDPMVQLINNRGFGYQLVF